MDRSDPSCVVVTIGWRPLDSRTDDGDGGGLCYHDNSQDESLPRPMLVGSRLK